MDIRPTYNCLRGRPWIHVMGAIPSLLHQKVKIIVNGQLISVMGEKEIMVSTPFPMEYIEEDEEALKTSFQALEIVASKHEGVTSSHPKLRLWQQKVLITNGFEPSKGLGRRLDGMANPMAIQKNLDGAARKAKSGWKGQSKQQARASLYYRFISGGIMILGHVAMVEDQPTMSVEWVYPMARELENWTAEAPNTENFPKINNAALAPDNADKSSRQDEEEETEEEALRELERLLEQERPKL
ncbi:hypothetical protein CR513_36564, partial [Mucuna pruriens]